MLPLTLNTYPFGTTRTYKLQLCSAGGLACKSHCKHLRDHGQFRVRHVRTIGRNALCFKGHSAWFNSDTLNIFLYDIDVGNTVAKFIEQAIRAFYFKVGGCILSCLYKRPTKRCKECGQKYKLVHSSCSPKVKSYYQGQIRTLTEEDDSQRPIFEFYKHLSLPCERHIMIVYDIESHSERQECVCVVGCLYDLDAMCVMTETMRGIELNGVLREVCDEMHDDGYFVLTDWTIDYCQLLLGIRNTALITRVNTLFLDILRCRVDDKQTLYMTIGYNTFRYDDILLAEDRLKQLSRSGGEFRFTYGQTGTKLTGMSISHPKSGNWLEPRDILRYVPALQDAKRSLRAVCDTLAIGVTKLECPFEVMDAFCEDNVTPKMRDRKTGFINRNCFTVLDKAEWKKCAETYGRRWAAFFVHYCKVDVECVVGLIGWLVGLFDESLNKAADVPEGVARVLRKPNDVFVYGTLPQLSFVVFASYMESLGETTVAEDGVLLSFCRQALRGGRCLSSIYGMELVDGQFGCVDIKSMYPSCMCAPMPMGKHELMSQREIACLQRLFDLGTYRFWEEKPFIARAMVWRDPPGWLDNCKKHGMSFFSGMCARNSMGELVWPSCGCFEEVWSCIDLHTMLRKGWTVTLSKVVWQQRRWSRGPGKFFSFFYDMKRNAPNKTVAACAKGFLNSLTGKFSQRPSDTEYVFGDVAPDADVLGVHSFGAGTQALSKVRVEPTNSKPLTLGISCLAYSRVMMEDMAARIFKYGGEPLYTDTDSAIADIRALRKWRRIEPHFFGEELGRFNTDMGRFTYNVELEGCKCCDGLFTRVCCLARKTYAMRNDVCGETKVRAKGMGGRVTYEDLIDAIGAYVSGDPNVTTRTSFSVHLFKQWRIHVTEMRRRINVVIPNYVTQCTRCLLFYSVTGETGRACSGADIHQLYSHNLTVTQARSFK